VDINKLVALISVGSTVVAVIGWIRECTRQQVSRDRHIKEMVADMTALVGKVDRVENLLERMEILVIKDAAANAQGKN
jgi:hypothetical protein